ncbi:MAG: hypothetical protein KKB51_12700 [Candidatus Riflebacteria bacterium]|nr:hypothetical protein [Candidatus Riflebacteria bacterium]
MLSHSRVKPQVGLIFLFAIFWMFSILPLQAADELVPDHVFLIRVVDAADGRGVPLVELEAFNALTCQSDNLGNIAIIEPDLHGKTVRFQVKGHGYQIPQLDFFGERSITVKVEPGASCTVKLERTAIAERLYRITGSGRYRDSILAGIDVKGQPTELVGDVVGLDSAVPVVWQNRLLSFYGDTLGTCKINLSGSGGEIDLQQPGVPDRQLPLKFFSDEDGFARRMVPLSEPGFVWLETVVPLIADQDGDKEILAARYVIHKTLEEAVETGYAVFEEQYGYFTPITRIQSSRHHKSARATPVKYGDAKGYCLQPWERVARNLTDFATPEKYEHYSCLEEIDPASATALTCRINDRNYKIDRDSGGKLLMKWRRSTLPSSAPVQKQLLKDGCINKNEIWLSMIELGSGHRLSDFTGSISYNQYRDRWIMIAQGNTGEIWYSEADTYTGPWLYARKIVEHNDYNFYNPVHHPWFDREAGRIIYFEGTYTAFFTPKERKTPRTDYNQVMYRLNLGDDRLIIPVPVYRLKHGAAGYRLLTAKHVNRADRWADIERVEFFAFDSDFGKPWLKAVYDHSANEDAKPDLQFESSGGDKPLFYVIDELLDTKDADLSRKILPELLEKRLGTVLRADNALLTFDPTITADNDVNNLHEPD